MRIDPTGNSTERATRGRGNIDVERESCACGYRPRRDSGGEKAVARKNEAKSVQDVKQAAQTCRQRGENAWSKLQ